MWVHLFIARFLDDSQSDELRLRDLWDSQLWAEERENVLCVQAPAFVPGPRTFFDCASRVWLLLLWIMPSRGLTALAVWDKLIIEDSPFRCYLEAKGDCCPIS